MLRCWALALNWVHTFNSAIGNNLFISLSWGEKTQSITCCSFAHEKKDSNNNNNERSRISPRHRYNIVCYFIGLHPTCFVIHKYNCSFRPLSASYRAFLFRYFLECAPAEKYTHTHTSPEWIWEYSFSQIPEMQKLNVDDENKINNNKLVKCWENNFCRWKCSKKHYNGWPVHTHTNGLKNDSKHIKVVKMFFFKKEENDTHIHTQQHAVQWQPKSLPCMQPTNWSDATFFRRN